MNGIGLHNNTDREINVSKIKDSRGILLIQSEPCAAETVPVRPLAASHPSSHRACLSSRPPTTKKPDASFRKGADDFGGDVEEENGPDERERQHENDERVPAFGFRG